MRSSINVVKSIKNLDKHLQNVILFESNITRYIVNYNQLYYSISIYIHDIGEIFVFQIIHLYSTPQGSERLFPPLSNQFIILFI